jgi:hypothetical protein
VVRNSKFWGIGPWTDKRAGNVSGSINQETTIKIVIKLSILCNCVISNVQVYGNY